MAFKDFAALWFVSLLLSTSLFAAVEVKGRQLLLDGKPFIMKAVCYNPVAKGRRHPDGLIFIKPTATGLEQLETDFRLMKEAGINTIRTYEPITDKKVLDLVEKYELYMIVPAFNYSETSLRRVVSTVETLKTNPRVILWEIGNEWNYNAFYSNPRLDDKTTIQLIRSAYSVIRTLDKSKPIATVHGELPSAKLLGELPEIDIWGINVYSGITFGKRFEEWKKLSSKAMYLGEFGADAFNANIKEVDEASQAKATAALLKEIQANLSANDPEAALVGASIYEWNDEWWKDETGKPETQETGGVAPGGGPYPDATFNEEWWGIVDMDRKTRPAYDELKAIWSVDQIAVPQNSTTEAQETSSGR